MANLQNEDSSKDDPNEKNGAVAVRRRMTLLPAAITRQVFLTALSKTLPAPAVIFARLFVTWFRMRLLSNLLLYFIISSIKLVVG
jgi:hypothetical protein